MAGLTESIRNDVKKAGTNKSKLIYFREGQKQRVRFLTDMDDGMEIKFHDSFEQGVNVPCQETFDRECPYCEMDGLRTRSQYVWSVYNYETKEVQLFLFPVNNCSPIPALMALYETYGTIVDRDYVISFTGKQQNKTYSVVPMDKVKFRNAKAKPYSDKTILKIIDKAMPADIDDEDDNEEEVKSKRRPTNSSASNKKGKKKSEPEEDYDDDDYDEDQDWNDESDEIDYSEMSALELYKLCKEREIKVQPKKPAKFYIKQLEEYDDAQEDWGDDDDDDEWEDED